MVRPEKTTRSRSRIGSLREMLQMPLDILLEIFRHLTPGDLLILSRTSKPFRRLLMNPESSFIWKDSRDNVPDMPDCPSFLSEQAYANLWFGYHCNNCGKPKGRVKFWDLGVRYCPFCQGKLFDSSTGVYLDLLSFNEGSLFPIPDEIIHNISGTEITFLRHKLTIENLKKRWGEIESDDQLQDAIAEYRMWRDERVEFAQACKAWLSRRKNIRKEELVQLRSNRMEEVCRRLENLGRGEDLAYSNQRYGKGYGPLWVIRNIEQPDPWTDISWKKMEREILEVMDKIRIERLFAIRRAAIEPRAKLFQKVLIPWRRSVGIISPHTHDLLLIPEVRSLIDVPPDGKGSEAMPVAREDLEKLEPVLYRYHREWKQEQLETITERVSSGFKLPYCSTGPFALAVSQFFTCSVCSRAFSFLHILLHSCTRSPYQEQQDTYESVIVHLTCHDRTTPRSIVLADPLRDVIVACGQDPATVTIDEMDALDVRLECGSCRVVGVLDVYNWREAFRHSQDNTTRHQSWYLPKRPPAWRQVTSTYTLLIKELESHLISNIEREKGGWICAHCPRNLRFDLLQNFHTTSNTHIEIISHLATVHAIHDPTENDYYSNQWQHPAAHYVSLIWQAPVSRQLQSKITNGEARIIDLFPDTR
ncbi:hypothetical protein QCA50_020352 [Cerrena zonata]|uniref:F-box domain-containing protein n=1 Tax=Cerrena zonata TaxID=2478898 RepID=A0AAW0FCR0_9APHY